MNQQALTQMWNHLRQVQGISMRVIAALPADKLDSHPIPNMRTPKELVVHTYLTSVKGIAEGVGRGEILPTEKDEPRIVAGIRSRDELLKFAADCWSAADKAVAGFTDKHLAADIKNPWDMPFVGYVAVGAIYDEFLHHRGQLYAYLRALGAEPPMMWDFEHNDPAYQAKTPAQA